MPSADCWNSLWSTRITFSASPTTEEITRGASKPNLSSAYFVSLFNSPRRTASASTPICCFKYAYTIADVIVSVSGFLCPKTITLLSNTFPPK